MVRSSITKGLLSVCAVAVALAGCHGSAKVGSRSGSVKSYHIKQKWQATPPKGNADEGYYETWYKDSNSLRFQMGKEKLEYVQILNPKEGIVWRDHHSLGVEPKHTAIINPIDAIDTKPIFSQYGVHPISKEELLKNAGQGAKIVGKETILGRACDVVEVNEPHNAKTTFAVDRESGLSLRLARSIGGRTYYQVSAVELEVNEPVSDEVFSYKIPAGSTVIKGPGEWLVQGASQRNWSQSAIDEHLRTLIKLKNVRAAVLYRPTYVPAGYAVYGMPAELSQLEMVPTSTPINYLNSKTGDTVVFVQSVTNEALEGSEFSQDGFFGTKVSGKEPYPYIILRWKAGKNSFSLFTSNLSESETIKIAKSVKSVPQK